jgi:hypothetical protein
MVTGTRFCVNGGGHPVPSEHAHRVPWGPTHGKDWPATCGGDPNPAAARPEPGDDP